LEDHLGYETSPKIIVSTKGHLLVDALCDLERAIACGEGRRREDDLLHDHEFQGMDLEGRTLRSEDLRELLDEFYALRGWNQATEVPTKRKLKEACFGDISSELDRMGLYK
jgi:aldehyde:ferredoxin oxidoreductase